MLSGSVAPSRSARRASVAERERRVDAGTTAERHFAACGEGTQIHESAVIVEPGAVWLGDGVTIEPLAVLIGHSDGELAIGDGTLVGPHAYLQGLGGLCIGAHVGVGAGVLMLTAVHAETPPGEPITSARQRYRRIDVGDGCDLG